MTRAQSARIVIVTSRLAISAQRDGGPTMGSGGRQRDPRVRRTDA